MRRALVSLRGKRRGELRPEVSLFHTKAHLKENACPANKLVDTAANEGRRSDSPTPEDNMLNLDPIYHLVHNGLSLSGNAVNQYFKSRRAQQIIDNGSGRNAFVGLNFIDHTASIKLEKHSCFRTAGLSKLRSLRFNAVPTRDRMRTDRPNGDCPLCDLCGEEVKVDSLPRGRRPDYVGHLYTCCHAGAVSLCERIDDSTSALNLLSDGQIHVDCCDAFRPDRFQTPKTRNGGPAPKYSTIRIDYLRGLVFENAETMLRTSKKEDSSTFRRTLATDIATVTDAAFSLLYDSARSHHKDRLRLKASETELAQRMQHLTLLLEHHAEPLGGLAEGDDLLGADMMEAHIEPDSDSEELDGQSEDGERAGPNVFELEMDEEAYRTTPLMSEDEEDACDGEEAEETHPVPPINSRTQPGQETRAPIMSIATDVTAGEDGEAFLTFSDFDSGDDDDDD